MASPNGFNGLSGLARRLVSKGVISEADAVDVTGRARATGRPFLSELLDTGAVDTAAACTVASREFGVPIVDINAMDWEKAPVSIVPDSLIRSLRAVPLMHRASKLFIAVSDPSDTRALNSFKFHTGLGVEMVLAEKQALDRAIEVALDLNDSTLADLVKDENLDDIDISAEQIDERDRVITAEQIDTPIVRFVNKLIVDAIRKGASDIHIEPYEKRTRVRFRVDGVLHEIASPPVTLAGRIVARVKILSNLDIAERRVPQDGRMKVQLSKTKVIDFRVSTLPTLFGEKCVIRLLDTSGVELDLVSLGFEPDQLKLYETAIKRPYGMVLVTGPTGSGKTTSLYSALKVLNTPDRNICSVEDPVEIYLPGVNQVNINEKANLTFSSALRAFLRQDPDIIMIGEIRDLETADIGVKASQTGHLVFSTVHTNDAPSTLTRLLNMGVAAFNIAGAVHLIIAQRLVRKLCEVCREPVEIPEPALLQAGFSEADFDELELYGPVGCDMCTAGYKGRLGVYEVMQVTPTLSKMMMEGRTEHDLADQAQRDGMRNLRQSGLLKAKHGITSLAEIERVTNL